MIVVDAGLLIAHLDRRDAHHDRAEHLLLEVADDALGASPITVAEILVGPARAGRLNAAHRALRELGLGQVALHADAAVRLAAMRAETGLKLPDCCVLLAAEQAPADALITFDRRLAQAALSFGIEVR